MRAGPIFAKIRSRLRREGAWATVRFLSSRAFRYHRYLVFEALLDSPRACTEWREDERPRWIGPETLDAEMTPDLLGFLGGEGAADNLDGVRNGDRLFVIRSGESIVHCGYIFFKTRQTKILGERGNPPLIACCQTAPAARGLGLYRRALNAELCYLRQQGYRRAVIETDPDNIASRKGIEAAGFRLRRDISVWIALNWLALQRAVETSGTRWQACLL